MNIIIVYKSSVLSWTNLHHYRVGDTVCRSHRVNEMLLTIAAKIFLNSLWSKMGSNKDLFLANTVYWCKKLWPSAFHYFHKVLKRFWWLTDHFSVRSKRASAILTRPSNTCLLECPRVTIIVACCVWYSPVSIARQTRQLMQIMCVNITMVLHRGTMLQYTEL